MLCGVFRFRLADEKDMAPYIARVKDAALQHALSFGVGYIHEAQPAIERQVVEYLFDAGAIQVGPASGVCQQQACVRCRMASVRICKAAGDGIKHRNRCRW
jgi:hypothetical protein